ncbi:response regulator [Patulibacter minatonensis]|uniref:response regulator n=1 Tax=Patulibacter minatonensis TaxID=298163 RepID=UPI00047C826F|nr:response regulator [Patulibacter minatonensis]
MRLAERTVLVVEDHEFQRRTIRQILSNLGVGSVLEAEDGEAALQRLDELHVGDVLVCDLDMPGMDGVELLRLVALRADGPSIVIASGLSAEVLSQAEDRARADGLTVLGAVRKPLTARRLLGVLQPT